MLELVDRPAAYEDVGRLCRWGMVIHELKNYEAEMRLLAPWRDVEPRESIDQFVLERQQRAREAPERDGERQRRRAARAPLEPCDRREVARGALLDDLRPRPLREMPRRTRA